jgi:hypothetical protein
MTTLFKTVWKDIFGYQKALQTSFEEQGHLPHAGKCVTCAITFFFAFDKILNCLHVDIIIMKISL